MILTGFSKDMNDENAEEALNTLGYKIKCTGTIDSELWHHDRWAYGSGGYANEMIADEIQDARRDGERHPLDR